MLSKFLCTILNSAYYNYDFDTFCRHLNIENPYVYNENDQKIPNIYAREKWEAFQMLGKSLCLLGTDNVTKVAESYIDNKLLILKINGEVPPLYLHYSEAQGYYFSESVESATRFTSYISSLNTFCQCLMEGVFLDLNIDLADIEIMLAPTLMGLSVAVLPILHSGKLQQHLE